MNAFQHPVLVHLPMAMTILLPVIILFGLILDRKKNGSGSIWFAISGILIITSIVCALALASGENAEELAERIVPESAIELHEKWASIFSGLVYIASALSVVHFFSTDILQKYSRYGLLVLSIFISITGYNTGKHGGELVYKYNAASALSQKTEIQMTIQGNQMADPYSDPAGGGGEETDEDDDD